MHFNAKYDQLRTEGDTAQWYANLQRGALITGDVYTRTLGLYCKWYATTPQEILEDAKSGKLNKDFGNIVGKLEQKGKAGSYIARFRKTLNSWCSFNGIDAGINGIKISGVGFAKTLVNETSPTQEQVAMLLRKGSLRARAIISLLAFSGLRPESIGNYNGSDGLRIGDVELLSVDKPKVEFSKLPAALTVRQSKVRLSKGGFRYITFIPEEGVKYISDYLDWRKNSGEDLTLESPLIRVDARFKSPKNNGFLSTPIVSERVREVIKLSGLKFRPYALRVYFETALDLSESKGLVSHNWREHWAGHKGDMSAIYSTNKVPLPAVIDEMRNAFSKCCQYIETEHLTIVEYRNSETNLKLLMVAGFEKEEIEKMNLEEMPTDELIKLIRERTAKDNQDKHNSQPTNRVEQKVINDNEIPLLLEQGWEFVSSISGGKSIMKRNVMEYKPF